MGGPMMGLAQYTLDVPVVKGTSGILVLADGVRAGRETTCIKCGRCVEICPMYLMPNRISDYAEIDKFDQCDAVRREGLHRVRRVRLRLRREAADRAPREVREAQPREEEAGRGESMSATSVVSVSPHLRDRDSTAKVMWGVFIALVPALAAATYLFGWRALLLAAVSVAVSVATEALSQLVFKREITVSDGSAVVTGVLLAFTCPPQTPLWMVALGAFVAIFLVKQLFGGVGHNIFNPALTARAVMLASFPVVMTSWSAPVRSFLGGVDATAAASALGIVKEAAKAGTAAAMPYGYLDLLLGSVPGSLGETCKIALLLGAAFLFVRRIHRLEDPRHLPRQRRRAVLDRRPGPAVRAALRRPDPRRLLHGHRLCYLADHGQRPDHLRPRLRRHHVPHPELRRLPRGRLLRDPLHEPLLAPHRKLRAAKAFRRDPGPEGGRPVKDILKIVFILFVVCGLAAGSLSFVNLATKDRIAAFAKEEKLAAFQKIFPAAQSFTERPPADGGEARDWDAVAGGAVVGRVHLLKPQGYSGPIELVFGEDAAGTLTGMQVLSHTETPGLGAKITAAAWADQFKGRKQDQVALKKDDSGGAIDAIAAATISSRAVTRAVHDAMSGDF